MYINYIKIEERRQNYLKNGNTTEN